MAAQGSDGTLIARRYARAFFELSGSQNRTEAIARDLETLRAMLAESADLRRMIANPLLPRAQQQKALVALAGKAGLDALTANFLAVLAANRRLDILPEALTALAAEISAARGEMVAEVTSATALTGAQEKALAEKLKKALGRVVTLTSKIDTALLGGLTVRIGSQLIDDSVRTKLDRLHRALRGQAASQEKNQMKEVA